MTFSLVNALFPAPVFAKEGSIEVFEDVAFLEDSRKEKVDIYLPPAEFIRPLPAVLLIHGGGWSGGSKSGKRMKDTAQMLAANGYAVFSTTYLLNRRGKDKDGETTYARIAWPQNLEDCKTALRFIRKESQKYGVDPARIATFGFSAGGHLAMLVGVTDDVPEINDLGLYKDQSNEVSCIINFYGRHDIATGREASFQGKTSEETAENVKAASPVTYFRADMPPFLIVQGTKDTTVPVSIARDIDQRLGELGVEHEYVEIEGAGHSFGLHPSQKDLRPVVLEFLKKHLE